jgi:hypothetical protein
VVSARNVCVWTFASGLSNAGEVLGFTRSGIPPGITIWSLSKGSWHKKCAAWPEGWDWVDRKGAFCLRSAGWVAGSGIPVFMDSGAYAESKEGAPALTDDQWEVVLTNYIAVAEAYEGTAARSLWLAFPDEVGSQAGTLRRLRKWQGALRDLIKLGVNPIVVLHAGGSRTRTQFADEVAKILGTRDLVLGFPVAQRRTTPQELTETLSRLRWRPKGVHLLGISPKSADWHAYLAALVDLPEELVVSSDAVMHRPLLKRTGPVGALTVEQRPDFRLGAELRQPDWWLPKAERRQIVREAMDAGLIPRVALGAEPESEYQEDQDPADWYAKNLVWTFQFSPTTALINWAGIVPAPFSKGGPAKWKSERGRWLKERLEQAYWELLERHTTALRKEQAIRRYYTGQRPNRLLRPNEVVRVAQACYPVSPLGQMELLPSPLLT